MLIQANQNVKKISTDRIMRRMPTEIMQYKDKITSKAIQILLPSFYFYNNYTF